MNQVPATHVNRCRDFFETSDNPDKVLPGVIMNLTLNRAKDFLSLCGFSEFIPKTPFAVSGRVSKFFGINPRYVDSAIRRYSFDEINYPYDVKRMTISEFLEERGLRESFRVLTHKDSEAFILEEIESGDSIQFGAGYNRPKLFLSSRIILAMPCYLCYGRSIPADSMVNVVYEKLKTTSIYDIAKKQASANRERLLGRTEEDPQTEPEPNPPSVSGMTDMGPDNMMVFKTNGDVQVNGNLFWRLVQSKTDATDEMMRLIQLLPGAMTRAFTDVLESSRIVVDMPRNSNSGIKLRKPENWEEVVELYNSGKARLRECARLTGMSVTSFQKYRKEGFD